MTRDEAVQKVQMELVPLHSLGSTDAVNSYSGVSQSLLRAEFTRASLIDTFVALGMLKLDEPKTAKKTFTDYMAACGNHHLVFDVLEAVDKCDLKLVEK